MKAYRIRYVLVILWVLSPICRANTTLSIAVIDWCPYICDIGSEHPGVLVEIVQQTYKNTEFEPEFVLLPWSRAIKEVESGKSMALLAPAKNEAPNLSYPKHPIGSQRFCFFSRQEDDWQYQHPKDIGTRSVVYPADALPTELAHIQLQSNTFQGLPYDVSFLEQTSKLLLRGYVDSILNTEFSMLYFQYKQALQHQIKSSGCLPQADLYLAFTPLASHTESVNIWRDVFDRIANSPEHQKQIDTIRAKYGL